MLCPGGLTHRLPRLPRPAVCISLRHILYRSSANCGVCSANSSRYALVEDMTLNTFRSAMRDRYDAGMCLMIACSSSRYSVSLSRYPLPLTRYIFSPGSANFFTNCETAVREIPHLAPSSTPEWNRPSASAPSNISCVTLICKNAELSSYS